MNTAVRMMDADPNGGAASRRLVVEHPETFKSRDERI